MEHLSLEIFDLATTENQNPTTSKYAMLPEDASITITDTSEIFASGDVWSHSFSLNVQANAHIFGSAGDMHGSRLHDQLDKRKARLWVEGVPLYFGYLKLGDEAEVDEDGNVDVTFESGQKTFEDLIEGAKASQVPTIGDVVFGMALWRKRYVSHQMQLSASPMFSNEGARSTASDVTTSDGGSNKNITITADGENEETPTQEYPRMVFPKGTFFNTNTETLEDIDYLNTDAPYAEDADGTPTHPYCNVALCYQRYGYEKKMQDNREVMDYSSEPEAQRGYEVMPADRVNSAPNFYVIYWIRCLMKHLGIHIEENQMLEVEDLKRLFFVNTRCEYREPDKIRAAGSGSKFTKYKFTAAGRLVPEQFVPIKDDKFYGPASIVKKDECKFEGYSVYVDPPYWETGYLPLTTPTVTGVKVELKEMLPMSRERKNKYEDENSYLHEAIATSDCFPDVEISEVIKAIESGFGVRFLFDENYQRVRIVLLRNIFRSSEVQTVNCDIISDSKVENNIRGFRMTYGNTEDSHFYYKGFADKLPHKKPIWPDESDKHDYSQWKLDATYASLLNSVSAFNKVCYVTPNNGNAYGVKVDKDAKRYEDLHPSLFEYAGFMDAEDGDCTGEEETIETIEMGFMPAIMNDVNFEEERTEPMTKQRFALFVDEQMRPRRPELKDDETDYNDPDALYDVDNKLYGRDEDGKYVYGDMMSDDGVVKPGEFAIASDLYMAPSGRLYATLTAIVMARHGTEIPAKIEPIAINWKASFKIMGHINEGYRLYLQDNFEPNDTGVSPIETHDWGLTLGIMRGSGSDAGVVYEADPDDMEGNETWHVEPGSSTSAHPDTCDSYGNLFDYTADGREDEQDPAGRFSLKLRAEKPNPYFDAKQPESAENKRYLDITDQKLRHRGLCDQFYQEYSKWVRDARIAKRTVRMEMAQFQAIDKTKKVTVGDITGFIRKRQFTVSKKTGLGMVTMEIMYI